MAANSCAVDLAAVESPGWSTGRTGPRRVGLLLNPQRRTRSCCRAGERDIFAQMFAFVFRTGLQVPALENRCIWREQGKSCRTITLCESTVETFRGRSNCYSVSRSDLRNYIARPKRQQQNESQQPPWP